MLTDIYEVSVWVGSTQKIMTKKKQKPTNQKKKNQKYIQRENFIFISKRHQNYIPFS